MSQDKLDTHIIHRPGVLDSHGIGKHERFSIDFVVNGHSLYDKLAAEQLDLVGRFSPDTSDLNEESAAIFLAMCPPDLENGRVMLFVCPECGSIGCGAITIKIERQGDIFVWSDFAYENNYDPEMTDHDSYKDIGPFTFDLDEYQRAIQEAIDTEHPLAA